MAPPLEIRLEVQLDNPSQKFFPGDQVEGKIFITSNQSYSLTKLRLAWTGRISVQPIQTNKDYRIYFDECWKLGKDISKSSTKTAKGSSQVMYYNTHLVPVNEPIPDTKVDLPKNKTIGFAFKVVVPNDRHLPSSTEGTVLNKITYLLEAFIDQESKPVFFAQRVVPVYEAIYTRTPEMIKPQRAEQVFAVALASLQREFTSAMRVTVPCRGCQSGIAVPVSITIWNNMEFSRKQGISISLFRVNHVIANGRAYTSPGEKVHRVVTDLNITSDKDDKNQHAQTVRIGLPIPKGTIPSISLEQSELLSVSYFIRVQVFAQEGFYTSTEGVRSQFMMVDVPFIIGTLAAPTSPVTTAGSSPTTSPRITIASPRTTASPRTVTSPLSSPKINYAQTSPIPSSKTITPVSSPRLLTSSFAAPVIPTPTVSITPVVTPIENDTESIAEKKNKIIAGVFRKSSSGSTISTEEVKKKRGMFSTLRLYGRSKSKKDEITAEITPTVVMTPRKEESDDVTVTNEDTVTLINDLNENTSKSTDPNHQKVFKMFEDSDSEDEEEITTEPTPVKVEPTGGVFNMFPDSDDDSDQEEVTGKEADSVMTPPTNQRLDSSHVFKLFPDSSDEEDEEEIGDLSVASKGYTLVDERVKPHEYKPNVKEYAHYKPDSK